MSMSEAILEEETPNPYNAKKSWHTPDRPNMGSADGLFYEPPQQATLEEEAPEEEEVQPAGIGAVSTEDEGEDVELPHDLDQVNGSAKINSTTGDDAGECEACTI